MSEMRSKCFAVVRTIGERSILDCLGSLVERDIPFAVLRYEPLELASKETIRIGSLLKDKYDWIIALDADIKLTMSKEQIEKYCENQEGGRPNDWCFAGWLNCTKRGLISGLNFFRTSECQKVYDYIKDKDFSFHKGREEYEIKKICKSEIGLNWDTGIELAPFGIHYFEINNSEK